MVRLPSSAWPLWAIGLLLAILVVPLTAYSGHLYYAEGGRSPDMPAMLLATIVLTAPVWGGAWLLFVAAYLLRYPGRVGFSWSLGETPLSLILSVVAFVASGFFVWLALARAQFWLPSRLPFFLHLLACAIFCQALRVAAVGRSRVSA